MMGMETDAGGGFYEADRPLTPDERCEAAISCLCWLIDNTSVDALVLVDETGVGRLRQITDEDEVRALVQRWTDYEIDQGVAAMERQQEGY